MRSTLCERVRQHPAAPAGRAPPRPAPPRPASERQCGRSGAGPDLPQPAPPSLTASVSHPAGPDHFQPPLGERWGRGRADTGHGCWSTWAALDNTGSGEVAVPPSFSLPVTHWTPLAENSGQAVRRTRREDDGPLSPIPEVPSALASSSSIPCDTGAGGDPCPGPQSSPFPPAVL